MSYESNGMMIIDEIDRLFVAYDKAKEYLAKISSGMDQQIDVWQSRRAIILDQMKLSSMDFLLPKTQRINELTIEAVEALCRAELLVEQIVRIDPKSSSLPLRPISASFSSRSINTIASSTPTNSALSQLHSTIKHRSGQPTLPVPVLRKPQQPPLSDRLSTRETGLFKPIEQQQQSVMQSDNTSRPTLVQPKPSSYPTAEGPNTARAIPSSHGTRTPQSDHRMSPTIRAPITQLVSRYQSSPRGKVKVKLQRIPSGTRWKQAKVDVIDSLSAFYAENLDAKVHETLIRMSEALHEHYDALERSNQLLPLENVSIGDFGVAKFSDDNRWYRARLLMCEENNRIGIVYIDFGNMETKFIDEFFPLDRLYAELPAQAIACTLSEAFPRVPNDQDSFWPRDTIDIFRKEVADKLLEISFVDAEEGTDQWPLHFVRITVGNQTVTNLLSLKQRIEPRPNRFIAEQLASSLTHQEYILFNVPINETESE